MTTDTQTKDSKRIAIVGGHGKVALQLIPILTGRGHTVVPLARKQDQLIELAALGTEPRGLDIEAASESDFAAVFEGCDAVVFAAGGGPDGNIERKRTVDLEGATKSIAGAKKAGISRLVQVSAIGVDSELPDDVEPVWKAYVEAKRDADAALRESGLDWTIIRPGGLTDEPASGRVSLAPEVERGQISRADVAHVLADCLDRPDTAGAQWEVVGGETPIPMALEGASR
ncbi:SDR family oxidoreductase [Demequina activiva]|uniref:NAD-dependent dehydratase n=1 Tax=Demequina activiva TaxID=1582364 RepID=A0A919UJQ5_9MICO|nr:SDR family oxidoreductase [Demequina activiva]GIG54070.1 NAD-dependent dehydratase [Demequina activiva]